MKILRKKIPLWVGLMGFLIPALPLLAIFISVVKHEMAIKSIYTKCHQLRTNMKLSEFYDIIGNEVSPEVYIKFRLSDSSYHHYIHYPPPSGQEYYYLIEFDPFTERIITPLPEACP